MGITAFPLVGLFFVVPRLEYGGGHIHGLLNIQDEEFGSLCLLLGLFHCQDEVWHAGCIFVEEEHVCAQGDNVERMESCGILLEELKEVTCKHLVEDCSAILQFVDVDFFNRSVDEFLAAIFGCLSNTVVFGASLVDGLGLFHFYHHRVFGNFVIPQAKVLRDGKRHTVVVGLIGCLRLDNAYDMVDTSCSVVGDGLEYIKELLFQGKKAVVVWLADDGQLGVKSILEKLRDIRCGTHSFFLSAYCWLKSTNKMASRTKALVIANWAFLSAMKTFVNPTAEATAEMHFTVKAVLSSNINSID